MPQIRHRFKDLNAPARKPTAKANDEDFSIREAKEIIADLFRYRPELYFLDFIACLLVGYGAAAIYFMSPGFSFAHVGGFLVSGAALFRCGVFIHEIVHMPRGEMTAFKLAYNTLFAPFTMSPSFMYKNHSDHHNWKHYGTARDGEYPQLGRGPRTAVLWYMAQVALLPAFAIFRFLVVTPISFLHPKLRRLVLERASSYVSVPSYRRELPPNEKRWTWALCELLCFAVLATLAYFLFSGKLAWVHFAEIYALGAYAAGLNWIRNLVAHTYTNDGREMTYVEQLRDSINLDGNPLLLAILFPVGMRYHALHHLFPALPYHAMGEAHRRLMERLPANSAYRRALRPGFLAAFRELWRNAGRGGATVVDTRTA